nr:fimbria/pilus outer membrane usher protein [Moraxella sp. ZY171148]
MVGGIRHSGSKEFSRNRFGERSTGKYISNETYARRGIVAIGGELTVGDFNAGGQLVEGVALRGVSIASDDRMLLTVTQKLPSIKPSRFCIRPPCRQVHL